MVELLDGPHALAAGEAIWIPAGTLHRPVTEPEALLIPILLPARPVPGDLRDVMTITVPAVWEDRLIFEFACALGFVDADRTGDAVIALVVSALRTAQTGLDSSDMLRPPPQPRSSEAAQIARRLRQSPSMSTPLSTLASDAGVSSRTVQRQFLAETGLTFTQWRTRARILVAAALMEQGKSVAWAAQHVGFTQTSGLTHAFRSILGTTPLQYRRTYESSRQSRASRPARALRRHDPPSALPPPAVPRQRTWTRVNAAHVLVWMYRGSATVTIGHSEHHLQHGDTLLIPAGMRCAVSIDPESILLPLGSGRAIDWSLPATPPSVSQPSSSERGLLRTMIANYTLLRPPGHDPQAVLADHLRRSSDRKDPTGRHESDVVRTIVSTLAANPSDARSLGSWARALNYDVATLRREFTAATGDSLPRWRTRLRMTMARELIQGGETSARVARRVGYAHPSGFVRAFTQTYGRPPRAYRPPSTVSGRSSTERGTEGRIDAHSGRENAPEDDSNTSRPEVRLPDGDAAPDLSGAGAAPPARP